MGTSSASPTAAGDRDSANPGEARIVRNVAVILAGGIGSRMGLEIPKQFVPIAGRTSLEHTVEVFQDCGLIDEILIMMEPACIDRARELLPRHRYPKIAGVHPGGEDRNRTSFLALQAITEADANVIFHDAVRPLVSASVIEACIDALATYAAVDTAIPSADTIVEVDENDHIVAVPPRARLRRGQTPQAFRLPTIAAAYDQAWKDPEFAATDDCSVVLKYLPDVPITVVPGQEANIKITHPIDIHLADKLFQLKNQASEALPGPAADLRGRTVVIFGGSSGIGERLGEQMTAAGANVVSHSRHRSSVFVEDRACVASALADAAARYGQVDHVVLTAGVLTVGRLVELTDDQLHHDVEVNLMAAFIVAQEAHTHLRQSGGSLLLYASSSYTRGRAKYTVYSATKAAIVNLTQALADEWGSDGIRVNCISPSRTATPMRTQAFGTEDGETLLQATTVAAASLKVLGSAMTGQVVDVRLPRTDPLSVHELAAAP